MARNGTEQIGLVMTDELFD